MISKRKMMVINTTLVMGIFFFPLIASYILGYGDTYRTLSYLLSGGLVMLGYYARMLVEWSRKKRNA